MTRIATLTRGLSLSVALTSAVTGACAPADHSGRVSSTAPVVGGDTAGAGGKMDETYRQIYVPGDPTYYNGR